METNLKRNLVVILLVVALAALGFSLVMHSRAAEAENSVQVQLSIVPVAKVIRRTLSNSIVLTAEFIPYQEVDVMAKVAGYVSDIPVDIGDRVKRGELLASLEVPELQDDIQRSIAAVQAAKAEVDSARGQVSRAAAGADIARLSYARLDEVALKDPGLVPQQDVDVSLSRQKQAAASLSSAQAALQSAQDRLQMALAEERRLNTLYDYTRITAPFAGVITKRYANLGSMVQAGISSQSQTMPLVRLSQNELLRLILPAPESVVSYIHVGQAVDVNVISLHRTFMGKVTRFADKIRTSTRTMDTEVDVPNSDLALVPGMYAEVSLILAQHPQTLTAPLGAIDGIGTSSPRVFRVGRDGSIEIVPVKIGLEGADRVELIGNIHESDLLVVGRHSELTSGTRVQPRISAFDREMAQED